MNILRRCVHFKDFLPNDTNGCTVFCCDRTTYSLGDTAWNTMVLFCAFLFDFLSSFLFSCQTIDQLFFSRYHCCLQVQVAWYNLLQLELQQKSMIQKGKDSWFYQNKHFDRILVKLLFKAALTCFSINVWDIHYFAPCNTTLGMIFPALKFLMGCEMQLQLHFHTKSGKHFIDNMLEFGSPYKRESTLFHVWYFFFRWELGQQTAAKGDKSNCNWW